MAARFPTTRWSRLGRVGDPADPESRAALEQLCRDYWFPLYAFIRARGHESHDAEDLVQGFLSELLERGDLARLDQSKGRFRSFLRAACDHYLANRRDHKCARKRGGAVAILSIDRLDAESRDVREPSHGRTPVLRSNANVRLRCWAGCSIGSKRSRSATGRESSSGGSGRPCRGRDWRPPIA